MTCDALVCTMGIGFSTTSVPHCDWLLCSLECLDGLLPEPSDARQPSPTSVKPLLCLTTASHVVSLLLETVHCLLVTLCTYVLMKFVCMIM